jgi:MFS family permease
VTAPVLLVVLRVVQGFALGGEWGGATLMVAEHAERERRGFWNGVMQMGSPLGSLLATAVVTGVMWLPEDALMSWGWRVPFLLSAVLLVAGLYVRLAVTESPVFQQVSLQKSHNIPLVQVLRRPANLLLACAVGIGPFALTALLSTYMLSYAIAIGYARSSVMTGLLFVSVTALVCTPVFSTISDRVGRRRVVVAGAIGILAFAWPMYALVDTGSVPLLITAMTLGQVLQAAMYAPLGVLLSEMFGTRIRYTGASMGYQLAALIGAGFTPLIASALLVNDVRSAPLVALAAGSALITVLAISRINETRGVDLAAGDDVQPADQTGGRPSAQWTPTDMV